MRRWGATGATVTLGAVLGCGAPEIPTNPSWDIDVYPLLRGSCLHCHGDSYGSTGALVRFDVCDPNAAAFAQLSLGAASTGLGAAVLSGLILASTEAPTMDAGAGSRPKMPPAPATPLTEREREILRRWASLAMKDAGLACRKQVPNRRPTVTMVGKPLAAATSLFVTLEIRDPDDDQVMGRATAGAASVDLTFTGRKMIELKGATAADKVSVKVTDGWTMVEKTF
jgi:hypothetical protein